MPVNKTNTINDPGILVGSKSYGFGTERWRRGEDKAGGRKKWSERREEKGEVRKEEGVQREGEAIHSRF